MIEWADDIRTSEKIFLRASTHGKRSFWGYRGAVLDKGDERIRVFPFPTRRPVSRPPVAAVISADSTLPELCRRSPSSSAVSRSSQRSKSRTCPKTPSRRSRTRI